MPPASLSAREVISPGPITERNTKKAPLLNILFISQSFMLYGHIPFSFPGARHHFLKHIISCYNPLQNIIDVYNGYCKKVVFGQCVCYFLLGGVKPDFYH